MNCDDDEINGKPFFYQYRSVNDRLIENLANNQIYFNDPRAFNDPFDSQYNIYLEGDRKQFLSYIKNNISLPKEIRAIFCSYGGEPNTNTYLDSAILNKLFEWEYVQQDGDLIKSTPKLEERIDGIKFPTACFNDDCKNMLMWSHYADYHKGVCLIYKSEEEDEYKIKLGDEDEKFQKINYDANVPAPINLLKKDEAKKADVFVLTKAPCWQYENEYRIILYDNKVKHKIVKYEKKCLVGIIFGLKVNYCDAHRVYKTIVDNYETNYETNFKFFESVQDTEEDNKDVKKYGIKINKIPDMPNYLKLLRVKYE